jgi:hypothetical protein
MPILARASGTVFDLSTPQRRQIAWNSLEIIYSNRLPPSETGMIVDRGVDFPPEMDAALREYGEDMWLFRDQSPAGTTRALNRYQGDHRGCATYFLACFFAPSRHLTAYRVSLRLLFWPSKKFSVPHPQVANHSA